MAAEWRQLSLREAGVELLDCEHKTPPAAAEGYPYVAIPQLKDGRIELGEARRISAEHHAQWTRKTKPQAWDVVLSRRCNPGETAFVPPGLDCSLGQNLVLLRSDDSTVDRKFLRWLTRGPQWWDEVRKFINVGAVFDSLKCADIPNFRLRLPPRTEQRAIATILSALDDKVELNRRLNRTLGAMARTIFQSWFVDFDPVRWNHMGQSPPAIARGISELFPSAFDESNLGTIPRGWNTGRLDDLITLQRGFDLPLSKRVDGPYPIIAASGESGAHSEYRARGPGVVTGRSGVLGKVYFVHRDFWPLNTSLWVKDFKGCTPSYAFHVLSRLDFGAFNAGSAVPTLNRNHVHNLPTLIPPRELIEAFDRIAMDLMRRQEFAKDESMIVEALRDALLPKLISGELRVPDAERVAGRML